MERIDSVTVEASEARRVLIDQADARAARADEIDRALQTGETGILDVEGVLLHTHPDDADAARARQRAREYRTEAQRLWFLASHLGDGPVVVDCDAMCRLGLFEI